MLGTEGFRKRLLAHLRCAAKLGQNRNSRLGVNDGFTSCNGTNRAFEVEALDIFDNETTGSRLNALCYQTFFGKRSEDDDCRLRVKARYIATEINAADPWKAYVEQDHVRMQTFDQFKCLFSIRCVPHDLKVRFRHQHSLQSFAHHFMIVDNEQANHSGTTAFTISPPSSPLVSKNCPSRSSRRRCIPVRPRWVALSR